ncbi:MULTISPECIES: S8 family peptidase [Methylococcus]|uniref:S8 family peptidase n=1 Tax=Methylococcus capsulatus TaxID=414 RepID=A0ABZ2F5R5_METCP|nr:MULTISPECIES: S8 family peptidase [Methylococcus]MDF9391101.1 protease [Methylococcus capsulatus]
MTKTRIHDPSVTVAAALAALLLGAAPPNAWAADAPARAIVMLKADVGTQAPRPADPALLGQWRAATGVALTWSGNTRTGAQILEFPSGISSADVQAAVRRMGAAEGVLWAESEGGQPVRSSRQQAKAAEVRLAIREFIVKLKSGDGETVEADVARLAAIAGIGLAPSRATTGAKVYRLARPVDEIEAREIERKLEAAAEVVYADPIRMKYARTVVPDDPKFKKEWHLHSGDGAQAGSANVQAAWELTRGSPEVAVAVVDSGILFKPTHPDLKSRLVFAGEDRTAIVGWDLVSDAKLARDGNGRDPRPKDEGDWRRAGYCGEGSEAQASSWHGSHVAGTVGAATDNGRGISGVDWFAKIIPVRVLAACGGDDADIADGIHWAAGRPDVPGTEPNPLPARVINLSLGGDGPCSDSYQAAIDYALSRNAVVVVAAGNEGEDTANKEPADCHGIIAVASVRPDGNLADYSNFGVQVAVAAPGGETADSDSYGILSTVNASKKRPAAGGMKYGWEQGTSMAAPVVSGVVSLMLAADTAGRLNPQTVREILMATARPFPEGSRCATDLQGLCGAGIVDAHAAVKAVQDLQ